MITGEPCAGKARQHGSGRGRRKRTRTTGTSSAAYFTRGGPSEKDQPSWHLAGGLPYLTPGSVGAGGATPLPPDRVRQGVAADVIA
jgi:hypothetical protein